MRSNPADARIRTAVVIHKISIRSSGGNEAAVIGVEPLIDGAIARVFIRRDASTRSLRCLASCLERGAAGRYAMGQVGSARSGYWPTIDLVEKRDLDQLRIKARRLIDGWTEFR
jgi:hypothetical protein